MGLDLFKNKKGFTLIELIIVILLLVILLGVLRRLFYNNNQIIIESQACMENTYGELYKYLIDASTGKGIGQISGSYIFPDTFSISVSQQTQSIELSYGSGTIYKTINFSGNQTNNFCISDIHHIYMSGDNAEITINKNLESNFGNSSLSIQTNTSNNEAKYELPFYFCWNDRGGVEECNKFYSIIIDRRTQNITHNKCLVFHTECEKRENE